MGTNSGSLRVGRGVVNSKRKNPQALKTSLKGRMNCFAPPSRPLFLVQERLFAAARHLVS